VYQVKEEGDSSILLVFDSLALSASESYSFIRAAARRRLVWHTCCSVLGSGGEPPCIPLEPICIHSLSACTFPVLVIIYIKHTYIHASSGSYSDGLSPEQITIWLPMP
jgi:hypothetical protein